MSPASLTSDAFIADVAVIYIDDGANKSFGSGRLIASGLILTARHVVDVPKIAPVDIGWRVRLIRDRTDEGIWNGAALEATVVWRGTLPSGEPLDLALLRIESHNPRPSLNLIFTSYPLFAPLEAASATGFPEARWDIHGRARDYTVHGRLINAEQGAEFDWAIPPANKPDDPTKWVGMSGAVVAREGKAGSLHLFGSVQEVPSNFSSGLLKVARLSVAFGDLNFVEALSEALGQKPALEPWTAIESSKSVDFDRSNQPTLLFEPRVPDHYRDRDGQFNQALFLIAATKWCGLYGLSGTGKTSTAARIARHVRTIMCKPVIWMTLGTQADATVLLEGLANAVGHSLRAVPDQGQKNAHLRAITSGLNGLLVFDDVRSSDQLDIALSSVGEGNAVLITSQQEYPDLAGKFGIAPIPLDGLLPNDGARVLLDLMEINDADEVRSAEWQVLASAVGNHPLALEIVAGDLKLSNVESPLRYMEDRIATGKWAQGEPALERLRKTILDSIEQADPIYSSKFICLGVFEGTAIDIAAVNEVCEFGSINETERFIKALQLRRIIRRRGERFTLHPFVANIAGTMNATRKIRLDRSATKRHIDHYYKILRQNGGYEWNLRKYPKLIPDEFEIFRSIDAAARLWIEHQDHSFRELCFNMTMLVSWYLHWRGYWDLRVRLCKRVTDSAERAGMQSLPDGKWVQVGNLYVDRGWIHLHQGNILDAEICAAGGETWLRDHGDEIFARELRAQILYEKKEFKPAVAMFESLQYSVASRTRAWFVFSYRFADALLASGETGRADEILTVLLAEIKNPKLVHNEIIEDVAGRILYRVALRSLAKGDKDSALSILKNAAQNFTISEIIAPERAAASIEMAALLADSKLYDDSRRYLDEAISQARTIGDFALIGRAEALLLLISGRADQ